MYDNIRKKVNKFYKGGKIPKFQEPALTVNYLGVDLATSESIMSQGYTEEESRRMHNYARGLVFKQNMKTEVEKLMTDDPTLSREDALAKYTKLLREDMEKESMEMELAELDEADRLSGIEALLKLLDQQTQAGIDAELEARKKARREKNLSNLGEVGAKYSGYLQGGVKMIDEALMGDKNFSAQSQAIDSAVHGVSSRLMLSGNPYAAAAGIALEGVNFLTKAGGQTILGFDVDINSSGYGDMGHRESNSMRSWVSQKSLLRKLDRRNEQARLAIQAAGIASDQSFEQEARNNSIQNTITNNQIALSGGTELNSLGA